VIARARRAVVSVIAGRTGAPHDGEGAERRYALGSGFLITSDGLLLTARHVIDGADEVRVDLDDGRSFPGAVVARDAVLDVALVRLRGARGLPVAALGSSDGIRVGDRVIAIGNPFGLGPSVSVGVLSATARSVDDDTCARPGASGPEPACVPGTEGRYLQTDAAMNPGDSGGPLLDERGQVVGINTAILAHGHGIAFALPIDAVRAVLVELQTTGRVARGYAGMELQKVDGPLSRALGLPSPTGALVSGVHAPGPAARAGLRPGDLVTEADGLPIAHAEDLAGAMSRKKPGEVIHFTLRREGKAGALTASVIFDRLPNRDGDAEVHAPQPPHPSGALGLHLRDASGGGALIDAIDPASAPAGLHPGDVVVEVDHAPITGAADAARRLSGPRPDRPQGRPPVLVRIRREGIFLYLGLDLSPS
jgi:serine protease Do